MIIYGVEITQEQQTKVLRRMQQPFAAAELEAEARAYGVPGKHDGMPVAYRLADRMIQRERKAGRITRWKRGWISR